MVCRVGDIRLLIRSVRPCQPQLPKNAYQKKRACGLAQALSDLSTHSRLLMARIRAIIEDVLYHVHDIINIDTVRAVDVANGERAEDLTTDEDDFDHRNGIIDIEITVNIGVTT